MGRESHPLVLRILHVAPVLVKMEEAVSLQLVRSGIHVCVLLTIMALTVKSMTLLVLPILAKMEVPALRTFLVVVTVVLVPLAMKARTVKLVSLLVSTPRLVPMVVCAHLDLELHTVAHVPRIISSALETVLLESPMGLIAPALLLLKLSLLLGEAMVSVNNTGRPTAHQPPLLAFLW